MRVLSHTATGLLLFIPTAHAFTFRPATMVRLTKPLQSSGGGDAVTGAKFEETDEAKNPSKRPGHAVAGMPEIDPETAAKQARIQEHQGGCTRLTWPEEIRTLMAQPNGFATLSTIHGATGCEGFPLGSKVGFAVEDDTGLPIFCEGRAELFRLLRAQIGERKRAILWHSLEGPSVGGALFNS